MKPTNSDIPLPRFPRREIELVRLFISQHNGQFTKAELREQLSAGIARQTFEEVIDFLLFQRRIVVDKQGKVSCVLASRPERQFSAREEANALTCHAFRNGFLEELHAGKQSELLSNPTLSRITDEEMKKLMIEASEKLASLLVMKQKDPAEYWRRIADYNDGYCRKWEK